jgi:hypothetical protein
MSIVFSAQAQLEPTFRCIASRCRNHDGGRHRGHVAVASDVREP